MNILVGCQMEYSNSLFAVLMTSSLANGDDTLLFSEKRSVSSPLASEDVINDIKVNKLIPAT